MVSGPLPPVNGWSSISLVTRSSECRRCREKKDGTVSQPKTFVIEIFTFVCVLGDLITSLNCVNVWFITLFFGNFGKNWDCEIPQVGTNPNYFQTKTCGYTRLQFNLWGGGGFFLSKTKLPNFMANCFISFTCTPPPPQKKKKIFSILGTFWHFGLLFALSIGMTMNAYLGQLALPDSEWRPSEKSQERKISP